MIWIRIINSINLIPGFEEHSGTAWTRIFDIQLCFSLLYLTKLFSTESGEQEVSVSGDYYLAYSIFKVPLHFYLSSQKYFIHLPTFGLNSA